jgi:hypothetical protein
MSPYDEGQRAGLPAVASAALPPGEIRRMAVRGEHHPGDAPCLLRRVCPECGSVSDSDPPTTCPQCGTTLPAG